MKGIGYFQNLRIVLESFWILPRWITGDLASTDQDDYFVSEDESEKRIFIIVQIFITFQLIACCILVEKCFNNSSFSVKRRIFHASNGKYN